MRRTRIRTQDCGLQATHVTVNSSEPRHTQPSSAASGASHEDTGKVMAPRNCPLCHCLNLGKESQPKHHNNLPDSRSSRAGSCRHHDPHLLTQSPFLRSTSSGLQDSSSALCLERWRAPENTESSFPITFPVSASLSSFEDMFEPQGPACLGIWMKTETGS